MEDSTQLMVLLSNQTEIELNHKPQPLVSTAYLLAYRIQERELFAKYYMNSKAKNPSTIIEDYVISIGVPSVTLSAAVNVKEILLDNLDKNNHKTALLKGVTQAYFDLSLFMGLATLTTGQDSLNYEQAVCAIKESLDTLEKGYERACDVLSVMNWTGEDADYQMVASGCISFSQLRTLLNKSIDTIILYKNNRVKYNLSYESIQYILDKYVKAEQWLLVNAKYIKAVLEFGSEVLAKEDLKKFVKQYKKAPSISDQLNNYVSPATREELTEWFDLGKSEIPLELRS